MRIRFLVVVLGTALSLLGGGAAAQAVPETREQIRLSFAPVVQRAAPAVVNVYSRRVVRAEASPLFDDPFFRRFFGDALGGAPQERIQRSLGSGVIVGADGLIVTNHHVIKDSDQITVVLSDRREFEARLLGSDARTDLAVLRIDPGGQPLPMLAMGDSDAVEVGDLVIAIGNPFGVGQTVTSGIVSALARTSVGVGDFQSFIQTDAAINPGNSGGALVTMDGKLVGINTAIYSRDGSSVGIGFAIPTTMVRAVLASLSKGGKPVRPWLGAAGQAVTSEIAISLRLARPLGVLINSVYPGGPAEKAGLKVGDVVVAVNGREVPDPESLRFRIATLPVGEKAEIAILRAGREQKTSLTLVPPPEQPPRSETELAGRHPLAGAVVANLNPALADEMGLDAAAPTVIIIRIRRGTVASRLQFRPGDLILRIDEQPVTSVAELQRRLAGRAAAWRVTIGRDGEVLTLVVGG